MHYQIIKCIGRIVTDYGDKDPKTGENVSVLVQYLMFIMVVYML